MDFISELLIDESTISIGDLNQKYGLIQKITKSDMDRIKSKLWNMDRVRFLHKIHRGKILIGSPKAATTIRDQDDISRIFS